jgi:CxxC motif-containing protein
MNDSQELICITCPKGCVAQVSKEGDLIKIAGRICKKGQAYIKQEYVEPKRILTSTVAVEDSLIKRLPVRTRQAVPKETLFCVMAALSNFRIKPPIKIGEVIVADVCGTGVDVVATDDL